MLPLFQDKFILGEATSSHFLFLRNSCFFSPFSEQLLFRRSETSTEQPLLDNRKFFIAVTFRNSFFFEGTVYNKDIYRRATFSKQVLLHSIIYFRRVTLWRKANFSEKQYSVLPTFSGELSF